MGMAKIYSKSEAGDLHKNKDSHLSTPVDAKTEWHLRTDDLDSDCKIGKNYNLVMPVVCTSMDDEATRFRQIGKPNIENMEEEEKENG